jgi:hypothetical protein
MPVGVINLSDANSLSLQGISLTWCQGCDWLGRIDLPNREVRKQNQLVYLKEKSIGLFDNSFLISTQENKVPDYTTKNLAFSRRMVQRHIPIVLAHLWSSWLDFVSAAVVACVKRLLLKARVHLPSASSGAHLGLGGGRKGDQFVNPSRRWLTTRYAAVSLWLTKES